MRLVKVPAMNLEPGMFVAELDRPWLETPFALQGFVVRDTSEILYVSDYVDQRETGTGLIVGNLHVVSALPDRSTFEFEQQLRSLRRGRIDRCGNGQKGEEHPDMAQYAFRSETHGLFSRLAYNSRTFPKWALKCNPR